MSRRESDDDYARIVCRLNDRWRVIECRDGIQWILQRQDATKSLHAAPWRSRSYCRNRTALKAVCVTHAGAIDAEAWAALDELPDRLGYGCSTI